MGIDLDCVEKSYGCSYGGWHYTRNIIIKATFKYLENKLELMKKEYPQCVHVDNKFYDYDEEEYYDIDREIRILDRLVKSYQINIPNSHTTLMNGIDELKAFAMTMRDFQLDHLIYLNVSGLHYFCDKSDCEGYYTVGNSYDIIQLFDLIIPFLDKEEFDIENLYELFKESIDKKQKIRIH